MWVRIDDHWSQHPKIRRAGKDGRSLWMAGVCYCARNLTDGAIPKEDFPLLAVEAEVTKKAASRLVELGLWLDRGDHWQMHDYLEYQPTREKVMAERQAAKERMARIRSGGGSRDYSAERSGEQKANVPPKFARGSATPSRSRPSSQNPSSSSQVGTGAPGDDDGFHRTVQLIVERKLANRSPDDPDRYRAAVEADVRRRMADAIAADLALGLTPEAVADSLQPLRPNRPSSGTVVAMSDYVPPPDPNRTMAAALELVAEADR